MNHNIFIEEHGQLLKYIHKQESDQKIVESEPRKKKEKIKKKTTTTTNGTKFMQDLMVKKQKFLLRKNCPNATTPPSGPLRNRMPHA